MRSVHHPGPALPPRIESFAGRGQVLDYMLQPGRTLNDALAGPLAEAGFTAAAMRFTGAGLGPFVYVVPHPSPDAEHVAWYSPPRIPAGTTTVEAAQVTFGFRDGAPFVHCHAIWREPGGNLRGGHIIPHETIIATGASVRAWAVSHIRIVAEPDAETNFTLFRPVPNAAPERDGPRLIVARVKPDQDIHHAIEACCRAHGASHATLRGSVGSLHAPRFADGRALDDVATEVFAAHGEVHPDASGNPRADIDMHVVDMRGDIHSGRLAHGENPVCVTFDLLLEVTA